MKKILALLLALLMATCLLTACGGDDTATDTNTEGGDVNQKPVLKMAIQPSHPLSSSTTGY